MPISGPQPFIRGRPPSPLFRSPREHPGKHAGVALNSAVAVTPATAKTSPPYAHPGPLLVGLQTLDPIQLGVESALFTRRAGHEIEDPTEKAADEARAMALVVHESTP